MLMVSLEFAAMAAVVALAKTFLAIAALRMKSFDLVVGNVFGSNAINMEIENDHSKLL